MKHNFKVMIFSFLSIFAVNAYSEDLLSGSIGDICNIFFDKKLYYVVALIAVGVYINSKISNR